MAGSFLRLALAAALALPALSVPVPGSEPNTASVVAASSKNLGTTTVNGVELTLLEKLGSGYEGDVYSALMGGGIGGIGGSGGGTLVAVKICREAARAGCLGQIAETEALSADLHGGDDDGDVDVVPILQHELGDGNGGVVKLVMPLAEGGTLTEDQRGGGAEGLSGEERRDLGVALFRRLAGWQARGWAHRDLHPANIVFATRRKAKGPVWFIDYTRATKENPTRLPYTIRSRWLPPEIPDKDVELAEPINPQLGDVYSLCLSMLTYLYGGRDEKQFLDDYRFRTATSSAAGRDRMIDRLVDEYSPASSTRYDDAAAAAREYKQLLREVLSLDPEKRPMADEVARRLGKLDPGVFDVKKRRAG